MTDAKKPEVITQLLHSEECGRSVLYDVYGNAICIIAAILNHIDTLTRERDEAVDRGLELQAQLMTMLVQRDEALVVDDADKLERAGRAIYEGLHASNGVFWHAVKEKHVWRGLAFNALTAALSEATP